MLNSTVEHMPISDSLKRTFKCDGGAKVTFPENPQELPYQLPYPLHFENTSATCMPAPAMSFPTDFLAWNGGLMDGWNTGRAAGFGMSYFSREDLPFYYTLADAFTVGD